MRSRIAIWASAGFLVAAFWAIYAIATSPMPLNPGEPILWALIELTCPIVLVSMHFHFGVQLPWVLLANAATYALVGWMVEILRQQLKHAH